jgi:hypothetical protein
MARLHGRNARLYVGIASGGTPEPISFLDKWSLTFAVADAEVTAFGDTNKIYVAGLPDASGTYSGFYDDAAAQLYTASTDGVGRKFYLYTNTTSNLQYWFGTGLFDFQVDADVGGAEKIQGNFKATTNIIKNG